MRAKEYTYLGVAAIDPSDVTLELTDAYLKAPSRENLDRLLARHSMHPSQIKDAHENTELNMHEMIKGRRRFLPIIPLTAEG